MRMIREMMNRRESEKLKTRRIRFKKQKGEGGIRKSRT